MNSERAGNVRASNVRRVLSCRILFGNKLGPLMRTSRTSDGFVTREGGKGVWEGSSVGREVESVGEGVNGDGK